MGSIADTLDSVTGARVRIVVHLRDGPCHVRADASQLETALINMAVNARDAMGPGIPAERLPHIFEPFFTTKGTGKGTGLGLSQVFSFAKQSGGDIDVESEPERGTAFTLYLPHFAPADGEVESPARPRRLIRGGGGRRVLVVEDNVEIGRFATQILDDLGYKGDWVANAGEALAKLAPSPACDVVFSDVVMPVMDGVDLAREVRRLYPDLLVVLTSGYSHVLAEERPHGFDLIHKLYSAEQLSAALRRVTA